MKAGHNKKSVRVEFVMSEQEAELIKGRMAELGITNLSAYLRKMAVDGYIIHLDMRDIQEMIRLLRICSNNLNQYTRRANETGSIYLFSGILICGCCGCRMTRKTNRYKDKEYHYYYCPTGKKNGCTSSVMLKESDLIECVQDSLKGHIENVASLDALLSSISQERINRELAQEYAAQIRVNEKRVAQTEGFKAKLYENLVSGILTKEEFLSYKRKYNADIELFQKAIAEWNEKLTDVLENRSERNRWINHFMKFSTMEGIDRRAVMQLIRSIRVMGKDELHIEFNYQDEYQKAISLAEQIATKNEERMVG